MRLFIALFITVSITAPSCEDPFLPGSEFEIGDTITIKLNESRYNVAHEFALTYDSLMADSRCPMNVNCVWMGNATVKINFITKGDILPFELHTLGADPYYSSVEISGLKIQLISVSPYPCLDCQYIREEDEAIVLVVTE